MRERAKSCFPDWSLVLYHTELLHIDSNDNRVIEQTLLQNQPESVWVQQGRPGDNFEKLR